MNSCKAADDSVRHTSHQWQHEGTYAARLIFKKCLHKMLTNLFNNLSTKMFTGPGLKKNHNLFKKKAMCSQKTPCLLERNHVILKEPNLLLKNPNVFLKKTPGLLGMTPAHNLMHWFPFQLTHSSPSSFRMFLEKTRCSLKNPMFFQKNPTFLKKTPCFLKKQCLFRNSPMSAWSGTRPVKG